MAVERGGRWLLHELATTAAGWLPPRDGPRLVIFAQGRTGSSLLESLLVSTGHVVGLGELLAPVHPAVRDPRRYVDGAARRAGGAAVWHCKIYHLTADRERLGAEPVPPGAFLRVLDRASWRIVHLRRRDLVRHTLSNLTAERRGAYHKRDDRPEETSVVVDREVLERTVARRAEHHRDELAALGDLPRFEVVYEDDLADPRWHQGTIDRLLDWLGLPSRPVSTDLTRINARPLSSIVANYDEFAGWVRALGMEESLDG